MNGTLSADDLRLKLRGLADQWNEAVKLLSYRGFSVSVRIAEREFTTGKPGSIAAFDVIGNETVLS